MFECATDTITIIFRTLDIYCHKRLESVIEIVAKRLKRGEIVEPKVKSMGQKFQFFGKFQDIHHMVARFSPVNQLSCASPKPFMLPHKFFVYRFGTLMPFACYARLDSGRRFNLGPILFAYIKFIWKMIKVKD